MRSSGPSRGLLVLLATYAIAGCSGAQPNLQAPATPAPSSTVTPTTARTSPSSAPSPSSDTRAQPAVDAYLNYVAAANTAKRNPPSLTTKPAGAADFMPWSFDPLRTEFGVYLANLQQQGVLFKGDSPQPHVRVRSMALESKPYPTVVLYDCPTVPASWQVYEAKSGKHVPFATPTAPLPKGSSIVVIYYEGHWGVQKVTGDMSIPCNA